MDQIQDNLSIKIIKLSNELQKTERERIHKYIPIINKLGRKVSACLQ
jgi:hypothetical protein